ncbi:hypothetical protein ACFWDQ_27050 [Streptomyces sp. NPDC060053]|uniref:hypothetical protein n=1 Tax=Streptomyces sp. NPDC060053 TaxID=3347047 RepID=UPI0036B1ABD5
MRNLGTVAAISVALVAGGVAAAPAAFAGGMACASIVASRLDPGGGRPNFITVENCGSQTQSWRYNLNSTGWKYVSIAPDKRKTTNFPDNYSKLQIDFRG